MRRRHNGAMFPRIALLCLSLLPLPVLGQRLFDTHLHYDADHSSGLAPADIVAILDRHQIDRAAITARPPEGVLALYRHAPSRFVPLLGVYRTPGDKANWWRDDGLTDWVRTRLADAPWRGVGELHLFAAGRRSPVFHRIVALATERKLPLLMHCDPAVIDALFEQTPEATVIWAHAGAYPYPDLIRDYLDRYPRLYVDLSVREARIAPGGVLADDWEWLLLERSDRFMVGVDTFRAERWANYGEVAARIRGWLGQLPDEVARRIARGNAERLFGTGR